MRNKLILSLFLLILISITATSQKLINSPYSRFNLGSIEPSGSFRSQGMGGVSVGMRGNNTLFFANPASYSSIDTNSFVFDFGMDFGRSTLSDGASTHTSDDFNFDHLLIGFPIAKGWAIGTGIVPYSNGYYKLSQTVTDEAVGQYVTNHSGSGGFSNFFVGSGIKVTKNFSIGANMSFLFGQISRTYEVKFADFYVYSNNSRENLQMQGLNLDYGIQYSAELKNSYFINAGVSLTSSKYFNTRYDHFSYKSTPNGNRDTISFDLNDSVPAFIPATLRAGITFGKKNKFTTGIDFITTRWSKSRIPGSDGYAADTKNVLFGVEYTPDRFSNYSFIKRMEYRLGGHVGTNYLIINGEQVKEYGASMGIGIPIRRSSFNRTNLYVDFTRKTGTSASGLNYENYITAGISLNFYDFWFIQRKYD